MTQFINLGIEKYLQYIFTSNKMQVIHKWSRKYTNKHSITKDVLKVSYDVIHMHNFISWKLHCLWVTWQNDNKATWNFFTYIKWLMLHQGNGKNLSTKVTIVVSQDCPKFLGSPMTCSSQMIEGCSDKKWNSYFLNFIMKIKAYSTNFVICYGPRNLLNAFFIFILLILLLFHCEYKILFL